MKKFLSLLLCLTLICTTIVVPAMSVSADDTAPYADYVPGEKPANLINSQTGSNPSFLQFFTQTKETVAKVVWNSWTQIRVTSQVAYDGTTKVGKAGNYMPGALIHDTIMPDGTVENDKSYVVNFYAKAAEGLDGTVRDTKVNVGVTNYRYESRLHTTKEYGDAGMEVSTDWKEFKGTIYVEPVHSSYASQRTAQVSLGLSTEALAGTGAIISDGVGGQPGKVYLAEEAAYDITNTRVGEDVTDIKQEAITLKAEVVNQLELPGYLNQEFTWVALNRARTQEIDGINIVVSDDTTTATVTADEEVANGMYDIVAYSEEYGMAKGYTVTVGEVTMYPDYVPSDVVTENMISEPLNANTYVARFGGVAELTHDSSAKTTTYTLDPTAVLYPSNPINGSELKSDAIIQGTNNNYLNSTFEANTNYIVSLRLRNDSPSVQPKFGVSMRAEDIANNTAEWYSDTVVLEANSDWQDFNICISIGEAGDKSTRLYIGYPSDGSFVEGSIVTLDRTKISMSKEVAHDINIIATETSMLEGGALSFSAEVLNQLGLPYGGTTDIEWLVMDKNRIRPAQGFTVAEVDDTVTVTAESGQVEHGVYSIIAKDESQGIEGFCKGIEFTVIPYYSEDIGSMTTRAKLNKTGEEWTNGSVSTGLAANILVEAELIGNTEAFTWFVLNSDRTALVDNCFDITVTAEGEKETAEVSVKADAPEGDYYVVAEAADGSLKGHPVTIDKSGDIIVVKDTIVSANTADIKAGLEGTYLPMLGLSASVPVNSADKDALAALLASSAASENMTNVADVATLSEIVERLSVVSLYNTNPQSIALSDADGKFLYKEELKLDEIDDLGVTLLSAYEALTTPQTKAMVNAALTGKGYTSHAAFYKAAKEQMMINALAYPNVNGVAYVEELFTAENLGALGIDTTKYLALSNKAAFNDTMANTLYTFADLKAKIESAEEVVVGGITGGTTGGTVSGGSSGGSSGSSSGGGFSVSSGASGNASGSAATTPAQTTSFKDVPQTHWAYSDIHYLKSIGVIAGVDAQNFAPEATVTREQFLKLIIEAFRISKKASTKVFSDVDYSAWYAPYVSAGVENGIITGTGESTFGTGIAITRQDACTILARALGFDEETDGELNFTDADSIADYASSSVAALAGYAIINGFEDGSFGPGAACSRAQAAKIIANAIGIVNAINADGR